MDRPSLVTTIGKLAIAGEPAGFSVEQMIRICPLVLLVSREEALASLYKF